ncbi:nucleotidyltransferase substrate binding protein [bacterium]|nr:nucleotidyltransferase substrate binding protein [bacterium]
METLDLTSFENAINSLNSIVVRFEREKDIDLRDAVIQRFEYTYSMSLKMIKRFLKQNDISEDEINGMTFNEIIRRANQFNLLLTNLETWDEYRKRRNMTSHTYDEETAQKVMIIIPAFKDEAEFLLNKLKEKLS